MFCLKINLSSFCLILPFERSSYSNFRCSINVLKIPGKLPFSGLSINSSTPSPKKKVQIKIKCLLPDFYINSVRFLNFVLHLKGKGKSDVRIEDDWLSVRIPTSRFRENVHLHKYLCNLNILLAQRPDPIYSTMKVHLQKGLSHGLCCCPSSSTRKCVSTFIKPFREIKMMCELL